MLTGSYDTASHVPRLEARRCACTPRPAARTRWSSPRRPTSTRPSRTSCGRRSATPGQKCSAASLAIVEASVYDDPAFHRRLADAVTQPARRRRSSTRRRRPGPLIAPPSGNLLRALTHAGAGRVVAGRSRAGSTTHGTLVVAGRARRRRRRARGSTCTECFGPVLGLMRATTSTTRSRCRTHPTTDSPAACTVLDPQEIDRWLDRVEVGNAYVNRHITGAIVQRQPFGGWKGSSIGAGAKPGGPHHLHGYGHWTQSPTRIWSAADASFRSAWAAALRAATTTRPAWPARATSCATGRSPGHRRSRRTTRPTRSLAAAGRRRLRGRR